MNNRGAMHLTFTLLLSYIIYLLFFFTHLNVTTSYTPNADYVTLTPFSRSKWVPIMYGLNPFSRSFEAIF